jgi:hypothetical protein
MSKAKLMNELINQYRLFLEKPDDKEINAYFVGFFEACKIILTEEQIMVSMNEGVKRFEIK